MNKKVSFKAFFGLLGLTLIAGCTAYQPPSKAVTRSSYTQVESSEHKKMSVPKNKTFSLEEAQIIAVRNNPDFKTKYYAIVAARAAYYQSFSTYLPTITVSDTFSHNIALKTSRTYDEYQKVNNTVGAKASWLVFDSLVREMNMLAAKHKWRQTEALELDARRLLVKSVANAYNEILLSMAKIRIARENMKFQNSQLKDNELKFEVGAVPLSNVLNFKAYYNTAETDLYTSQYTYAAAKYALAKLMGLTEGNIPDEVKFPGVPSPDGETLLDLNIYLDTALANRPDLKAYREALEVSKFNYWSSICSFGPTLTFNTEIGYSSGRTRYEYADTNSTETSSHDTSDFTYGLTASWEIFSGGRTYFNMRQQQATMRQNDFVLANNWITIITEVRTAYDNYQTILKNVKISQKSLELYRKIRDLVAEEYQAGNTELTRLNEAQRDFVSAEVTFATNVINMHNAKAQLLAAIGNY